MSLCVCTLIPSLQTRTRVVLVVHRCEARKPMFRAMVERTLWSRGSIGLSDVNDGVPSGTRRDVPWG